MYNISFKSSVKHDLTGIDAKQIKRILDKIQENLSVKPDHYPELKGKFAGLRKFRVANYRIIYSINSGKSVLILRIKHRKEVYE